MRSPAEQAVPIVEHFRLDASKKLGRALGIGAALVTVGALSIASSIVLARIDPARPHARAAAISGTSPLFRGQPVTADGAPIDAGPSPLELALALGGIVVIAAGGASAIVGLRSLMLEESYLALSADGALYRAGELRSFVPWDEIEEVRWDGCAVQFVRHDGSAWARRERYAGIDGATLARRAADVRRRALFGLIKPRWRAPYGSPEGE